ncbi:hypothetical protein EFN20_03750 [Propionibacterium freudenreichii]|nr:hypothetical protein BMR99_11625 [Propionibacterium freudenreichii]MCT2975890.1 hypothetical protein [Propionibacterium freudenreichii]MCT2980803.1 hypothetical protein [Propionibacterium freudenreichii]MCT2988322.1 hypothetical protein [Propionibacterium freudenreichii]MCT2991865.1 hypothetical protein [Propionibacterium freudenreichii]
MVVTDGARRTHFEGLDVTPINGVAGHLAVLLRSDLQFRGVSQRTRRLPVILHRIAQWFAHRDHLHPY